MQSTSRNRISRYCFKRVGERRSNTLQLGSHKAFLHLPTMIFLYFASLFPNCQRPSEYVFHLEHKTSVEHLLMALASSCCATCGTRLILSFQIARKACPLATRGRFPEVSGSCGCVHQIERSGFWGKQSSMGIQSGKQKYVDFFWKIAYNNQQAVT